MRPFRLFNTLTRQVEELKPIAPPEVRLYTCGPTVYQYAHIGNLRTYIFEDLLRRSMRAAGYKLKHVMNITDVGHLTSDADTGEDKMELGARKLGKTAWEIAEFFTQAFFRDHSLLNCEKPEVVVKATDYVAKPAARWDMLRLVQDLEKRGFTYKTSDGIYFDTAKLPDYGKLAGAEHIEGLKGGARVEQSAEKRNLTDFALWKFSPAGQKRQMEWDSPWGKGFPGWHLECSVMAMDNLGDTFDIHCGGVDHIAVHHTNEIAQSEAATGKPYVHTWLHGEFLVLTGKAKMAKSAENFLTLDRLVEEGKSRPQKGPYDPLAYRYLCLSAHYRTQLEFSWEAMDFAQRSLEALRTHYWRLEQEGGANGASAPDALDKFLDATRDDLNIPKALGLLWEAARDESLPPASRRKLLDEADKILGLKVDDLARKPPPSEVLGLIKDREAARRDRDYKKADELRDKIGGHGFYVEDTPAGPRLIRK